MDNCYLVVTAIIRRQMRISMVITATGFQPNIIQVSVAPSTHIMFKSVDDKILIIIVVI